MFEALKSLPPDSLLALIKAYQDDERTGKLDLGVGVYRDDAGSTPVMEAVKSAERILLETQDTKAYLGPEGDMGFVAALQPFVFGAGAAGVTGLQTPGGSGALRLGAELLASARPGVRIWLGAPTWPNHAPVFQAAGATVCWYRYFDTSTQTVLFDEMMTSLGGAERGDVVLLHACCHNPTGADLDPKQWSEVAADESLVAYSCDKNFGLYRDRVGALFALTRNSSRTAIIDSNMASLARVNWSMPPDHGAALARIILESKDLQQVWHDELVRMCVRIIEVRLFLATLEPQLQFLANQRGLFSNMALTPPQIDALRVKHGIYMAPSGRANLAGMRAADAGKLVAALADVGALEERRRAGAS